MEWTVSPPHRALFSARKDDPLYILHFLQVPKEDPHLEAFVEFWRRLLSEGPGFWTRSPEALWFQFWTDTGQISATFTSDEHMREEPGVFMFSSERIYEEYAEIADSEQSDDDFSMNHDAMMMKYWNLFLQAASIEPIPQLLQDARARCPFELIGTYCCYLDNAIAMNL